MMTGLIYQGPVRRGFTGLIALVVVLTAGACSTYHRRSVEIKASFTEADYEQALERVEQIDRGSSELLYLYEKGLILHYENSWVESNEVFERAELLLEELYTKSVSRELAALVVTDNIARYRGTAYEAMLVNYYKILNYLYLDDVDGAVVECRRVNRKLEYLRDTEGLFFSNDPFLQYLTGMVYRAAGDWSNADVSFRVAMSEYQNLAADYGIAIPRHLSCDGAAVSAALGDAVAADTMEAGCPPPAPDSSGVVNLFLECGFVAHMQERKVALPVFTSDDSSDSEALSEILAARDGQDVVSYQGDRKVDYILKIAVPVMVPTPVPWEYAIVRPVWSPDSLGTPSPLDPALGDGVYTDAVENIDAYAQADYDEGYHNMVARTVARALAKYAAKKGADSQDETLGWVVNWFNVLTETADTREWTTLPERILMTRLILPAGNYSLHVRLVDSAGYTVSDFDIEGVTVVPGKAVFLNHRVF
jgi:hypothetical protein